MTATLVKFVLSMIALGLAVYALVLTILTERKRKEYWKDSAIKNARGRLTKDKEFRKEANLIHRRAAERIAELNAENEELIGEIRRLRVINNRLWHQIKGGEDEGADDRNAAEA